MSASVSSPERGQPIGVFDSGVGGLTVLRALRASLPAESFVYLGDTARLPYGTKSAHTVERYALQAADRAGGARHQVPGRGLQHGLGGRAPGHARALPRTAGHWRDRARCARGVRRLGQRAHGGARHREHGAWRAPTRRRSRAFARRPKSAPSPAVLFVALAEEGWVEGPIAAAVAARYLAPLRSDQDHMIDTLVLGCTHFPALGAVIAAAAGSGVQIVDSAATTAATVHAELAQRSLLRVDAAGGGELRLLATDGVERFASVGGRFLGANLRAENIELVDF